MSKDSRVVVITGSARGIGRAMAELFLASGARVALIDKLESDLKEWAGGIEDALTFGCDITKKAEIEAVRDKVMDKFGRIDVLLNNAGWQGPVNVGIEDMPEEAWRGVIDINLTGTFLCTQVFGPKMFEKGGVIINTASLAAFNPIPNCAPYCPSKAAVVMLTKVAALEWGKYKIRVNAICPGMTETSMNAERINKPGAREARSALVPLGRIGRTSDIANVAFFLASPEAEYISGETILVDGGMTIRTLQPLGSI